MAKKQMQIIVNLGRFHSLQGKSVQGKRELMTWKSKKRFRLNYNVVEIDRLECVFFFSFIKQMYSVRHVAISKFPLFGQYARACSLFKQIKIDRWMNPNTSKSKSNRWNNIFALCVRRIKAWVFLSSKYVQFILISSNDFFLHTLEHSMWKRRGSFATNVRLKSDFLRGYKRTLHWEWSRYSIREGCSAR